MNGGGSVMTPGVRAAALRQHRLHLAPGRLVADAHLRVQDQTAPARERAVVHHLAVEDGRVGDDHLLVLDGPQVRHLEPHLGHVAHRVADLDAVAEPERPPVGHGVAGDQVGDGRGRAHREEDPEEDREALEGIRARARDVRVRHDQSERDDGDAQKLVGRLGPFPLEARERDLAAPDRGEEQADELEQ